MPLLTKEYLSEEISKILGVGEHRKGISSKRCKFLDITSRYIDFEDSNERIKKNNLIKSINSYSSSLKNEEIMPSDVPLELNANGNVYKIAISILRDALSAFNNKKLTIPNIINYSHDVACRRLKIQSLEGFVNYQNRITGDREGNENIKLYKFIRSIIETTYQTRTEAQLIFKKYKNFYSTHDEDEKLDEDDTGKYNAIESESKTKGIMVVGKARYIVRQFESVYGLCKNNSKPVFITNKHFDKLLQFMKAISNLLICKIDIFSKVDSETFLTSLLDLFESLSDQDPEMVGEVLRAARANLIARLDKDNVAGLNPSSMLMGTYSNEKRLMVQEALIAINFLTSSPTDAINLSNIYKIVPHPDLDLFESFRKLDGLRKPNQARPNYINAAKAKLRKDIYFSLCSSGYEVRALGGTDAELIDLINASIPNMSRLKQIDEMRWCDIVYARIEKLRGFMDAEVNIQDKSSAPFIVPDFNELDRLKLESKNKKHIGGVIDGADSYSPINDVVSALSRTSKLNAREGAAFVTRSGQKFRNFENLLSNYNGKPGQYETISEEDHIEFLKQNPDVCHLVLTEPKLGEKHKKNTRIFYMASQPVKSYLQRVERLARQISRKQIGVSITKTYMSRRRDLETMCAAMRSIGNGRKNVFLSFDLSEFSKKFPMSLIRVYSEILHEVTGEESLLYLDTIFKTSVVIHNTRGFLDYMVGIKGGFEGFLNFVWSSIHAAIMRIALDEAGVSGSVLVYSDDGILTMDVPDDISKENMMRIVTVIRETYEGSGLDFNLGKTVISDIVWEYLGDVCFNGKLVPMFVKEVCSLGEIETSEGFHPFYYKIDTIRSQAEAACRSGLSPIIGTYIMVFEACIKIMSVFKHLKEPELLLLTIINPNMGGFRLPCIEQMTMSSSLESDSFLLDDLLSLEMYDKNLTRRFLAVWHMNMPISSNEVKMLIAGSRFKIAVPETSGTACYNRLIEAVIAAGSHNVSKNPVTLDVCNDILVVLQNLSDVQPEFIKSLVINSPVYVAYMDSIKLMRSRGIIKVLSRSDVRDEQINDINNVRNAINILIGGMRETNEINMSVEQFVNTYIRNIYKTVKVAPIRRSFRHKISKCYENHDLSVLVNTGENENPLERGIYDLTYVEPSESKVDLGTRLSWLSENYRSLTDAATKKLELVASAIVTDNPSLDQAVKAICAVLGVYIPSISAGDARSIMRKRARTGERPDVVDKLLKSLMSRSKVILTYNLTFVFKQGYRNDRSTFIAYVKNKGVLESYMFGRPHISMTPSGTNIHSIKIKGDYESLFNEPFTDMDSKYDQKEVDRIIRKHSHVSDFKDIKDKIARDSDYSNHISEIIRTKLVLDNMEVGGYLMDEDGDFSLLFEIIVDSVFNSFKDIFLRRTLGYDIRISLPVMPQMAVFSIIKESILRCLYEYIKQSFTNNDLIKLGDRKEGKIRAKIYDSIGKFVNMIEEGASLVTSNILTYDSVEEIFKNRDDVVDFIINYNNKKMFRIGSDEKIIVCSTQNEKDNKATKTRVNIIKDIYKQLLTDIMQIGHETKWDTETIKFKMKLNNQTNVDDLITYLSLSMSILRSSDHRVAAKPFNPITYQIEYGKLVLCVKLFAKYVKDLIFKYKIHDKTGKKELKSFHEIVLTDVDKFVNKFRLNETESSMIENKYYRYYIEKSKVSNVWSAHGYQLRCTLPYTIARRAAQICRMMVSGTDTKEVGIASIRYKDSGELLNVIDTFGEALRLGESIRTYFLDSLINKINSRIVIIKGGITNYVRKHMEDYEDRPEAILPVKVIDLPAVATRISTDTLNDKEQHLLSSNIVALTRELGWSEFKIINKTTPTISYICNINCNKAESINNKSISDDSSSNSKGKVKFGAYSSSSIDELIILASKMKMTGNTVFSIIKKETKVRDEGKDFIDESSFLSEDHYAKLAQMIYGDEIFLVADWAPPAIINRNMQNISFDFDNSLISEEELVDLCELAAEGDYSQIASTLMEGIDRHDTENPVLRAALGYYTLHLMKYGDDEERGDNKEKIERGFLATDSSSDLSSDEISTDYSGLSGIEYIKSKSRNSSKYSLTLDDIKNIYDKKAHSINSDSDDSKGHDKSGHIDIKESKVRASARVSTLLSHLISHNVLVTDKLKSDTGKESTMLSELDGLNSITRDGYVAVRSSKDGKVIVYMPYMAHQTMMYKIYNYIKFNDVKGDDVRKYYELQARKYLSKIYKRNRIAESLGRIRPNDKSSSNDGKNNVPRNVKVSWFKTRSENEEKYKNQEKNIKKLSNMAKIIKPDLSNSKPIKKVDKRLKEKGIDNGVLINNIKKLKNDSEESSEFHVIDDENILDKDDKKAVEDDILTDFDYSQLIDYPRAGDRKERKKRISDDDEDIYSSSSSSSSDSDDNKGKEAIKNKSKSKTKNKTIARKRETYQSESLVSAMIPSNKKNLKNVDKIKASALYIGEDESDYDENKVDDSYDEKLDSDDELPTDRKGAIIDNHKYSYLIPERVSDNDDDGFVSGDIKVLEGNLKSRDKPIYTKDDSGIIYKVNVTYILLYATDSYQYKDEVVKSKSSRQYVKFPNSIRDFFFNESVERDISYKVSNYMIRLTTRAMGSSSIGRQDKVVISKPHVDSLAMTKLNPIKRIENDPALIVCSALSATSNVTRYGVIIYSTMLFLSGNSFDDVFNEYVRETIKEIANDVTAVLEGKDNLLRKSVLNDISAVLTWLKSLNLAPKIKIRDKCNEILDFMYRNTIGPPVRAIVTVKGRAKTLEQVKIHFQGSQLDIDECLKGNDDLSDRLYDNVELQNMGTSSAVIEFNIDQPEFGDDDGDQDE